MIIGVTHDHDGRAIQRLQSFVRIPGCVEMSLLGIALPLLLTADAACRPKPV